MALKVRYTQPLIGEASALGYLIAVPGASVLIRQNGVAATVYASNAGAPLANPVPTGVSQGVAGLDGNGTLLLYLTPGNSYDGVATVGATVSSFAIPDISPDVADVQPGDSDLTAIAALTTSSYGRAFLALADAAAARTATGASSQVDLTAEVTNRTNADALLIPKAVVDAKGDLIAATAADVVARLAAGANGFVLTADSAEATGLKWATAVPAMPLLGTQTGTTRQNVYELQPATAGLGHFSAGVYGTVFNGTTDHVFQLGYNTAKTITTEPTFRFTIEHDYNENGFHWMEPYFEYSGKGSFAKTITNIGRTGGVVTVTTSTAHSLVVGQGLKVASDNVSLTRNTIVASTPTTTTFTYALAGPDIAAGASGGAISEVQYRPIFFGIGRDNGQLIRSWYQAGSGGFVVQDWATNNELAVITDSSAIFNLPLLLINGSDTSSPQFVMQSAAVTWFSIEAAANYVANLSVGGGIVARLQYAAAQGASLSVGTDAFGGCAAAFKLTGTAFDDFELRTVWLQKAVGQIGPFLEWTDTDDTTIWGRISKNGYYETRRTVAPADADLVPGALMFWFDSTNGAAKPMFKAKQSDGTVVAASMGGASAPLVLTAGATNVTPLTLQGAAGQTSTLLRFIDSAGNDLARFSPTGALGLGVPPSGGSALDVRPSAIGTTPTVILRSGRNAGDVTANQTIMEAWSYDKLNTRPLGYLDYLGRWVLNPGADATIGDTVDASMQIGTRIAGALGVVVQASASQTADLQQYRTSDGVFPSRFNKAGTFMTRAAAPADADVATGEMALWFDSTNGAAKLMVKAKSANGTVVSGSVALA